MTKRGSERGNVFFALFGAVALVGVVGAATSTLMRGPVSTVMSVNQRTKADTHMQIASKLAMVRAAQQGNSGDCDNDGTIEPMAPDAMGGLTGGGAMPAAIGAAQLDPWNTKYGYCAWDLGAMVDDGTCGGPGVRLTGGNNMAYPVMVIISAGADKIFQTSCNDWVDTTPADNIPDNATTLINTPAGADDIILSFTYSEAVQAAGGLWSLMSGNPDTITTDKDVAFASGTDVDFSSGTTASFQGTAEFTPNSRLDLGLGGMFLLPTQGTSGACSSANDTMLRVNTTPTNALEICDEPDPVGAPGVWSWVAINGAAATVPAGGANGELQFNSAGTLDGATNLIWNEATTQLGIGGAPSVALDVTGAAEISTTLAVTGNTTIGGTLDVTGFAEAPTFRFDASNFLTYSAAGIDFTTAGVSEMILEPGGNLGIGVADPNVTLDVSGDAQISGDTTSSRYIATTNGSAASPSLSFGSGSGLGLYAGANLLGFTVGGATGLTLDNNGDGTFSGYASADSFQFSSGQGMYPAGSGLNLTGGNVGIGQPSPSTALDVNGEIRVGGSVATNCTAAITGAIRFASGDKLEVCISTNVWAVVGASGGGGSGSGSNWTKLSDNRLYYNQNDVGVGTADPLADFHASGNLLVTGALGAGDTTPLTGAGTRMMYVPNKGALRAGGVSGTQWDHGNIGNYSTASGYDVGASGVGAVALGNEATASGANSFAFGLGDPTSNPVVSGNRSFGIFMGDQSGVSVVTDNLMTLLGGKLMIDPDQTSATNLIPSGLLTVDVEGDIGAMQYCDELGQDCFTAADIVGGGVGVWEDVSNVIRLTSGTVNYSSASFVFGSPQLDGDGDPAHDKRVIFDKIKGAFRAGGATSAWDNANLGNYSFAGGADTQAAGDYSVALGQGASAADDNTVALGYFTEANGPYSTAIGAEAAAAGSNSMAIGLGNLVPLTTKPVVSGTSSLGIFMGTQDAVNFASSNTMGLFGGKMIIDPAIPATQLATSGLLTLDIEGDVGAIQYCDENGLNCFTAAGVAGGTVAAGNDREIQFNSGGGLGADAGLVFTSAGRLGVGAASPAVRLQVQDNVNGEIMRLDNLSTTGVSRLTFYENGTYRGGFAYSMDNDQFELVGAGGQGLAFFTDNVYPPRMIINTAGNVGIGTLTPQAQLDVGGTGALLMPRGTTAERPASPVNGMIRYNSANGKFEGYQAGAWQDILTGAATSTFLSLTDTPASYAGVANQYVRVNAATTALEFTSEIVRSVTGEPAPDYLGLNDLLDVDLTVAPIEGQILKYVSASGLWVAGTVSPSAVSAAGSDREIQFNSGGSLGADAGLVFTSAGRLGIGTTAPASPLHVNFGVQGAVTLGNTDNINGFSSLGFRDETSGNGKWSVGLFADSYGIPALQNAFHIVQSRNKAEGAVGLFRFVIDDAGNVGIGTGTTAPQAQLDIAGTGAMLMPRGDTAQRPASPVNGMIRYNSANGKFEGYQAGAWQDILTGAATSTFLSLTDTPSSYAGAANQYVRVNAATNALEFTNEIVGNVSGQPAPNFIDLDDLSDVDLSVAPTDGQILKYVSASGLWIAGTVSSSSVSAAGNNGEVQFNSNGALGASANLFWDDANGELGIGISPSYGLDIQATAGTPLRVRDASGRVYIDTGTRTGGFGTVPTTTIAERLTIDSSSADGGNDTIIRHPVNSITIAESDNAGLPGTFVVRQKGGNAALGINQDTGGDSYFQTNLGIGTPTPQAQLDVAGTGAMLVPRGTTAQRPASPVNGMLRYNSANGKFEGYQAGAWQDILTGAATGTFLSLTDTPASYAGAASQYVRVNAGTNALEFTDQIVGTISGEPAPNFINLNDLSDVDLTVAPTDGQVLKYVSASGLWIAAADGGGGGGTTLDGLDDVKTDYATDHNIFAGTHATTPGANWPVGAQYNTFFGEAAGLGSGSTTIAADRNAGFGYGALFSNTEGYQNTATGANALYSNTTGRDNLASGSWALYLNTTGAQNTALGSQALFANTTGNVNTASGNNAMGGNTTGSYNTATGINALAGNVAKSKNTAVGANAMYYADDTAVASDAHNTAVGFEALKGSGTPANNTGVQNTVLGAQALTFNTSGSGNIANGTFALLMNTTGSYNTATGMMALNANSVANFNAAYGAYALLYSKAKGKNTALGTYAMYYADDTTTPGDGFNTAVGYLALQGSAVPANNTGTRNTALGANTMLNATSGSNNIAIGYQAGDLITTGNRNIIIGYDIDPLLATTNEYLNIGGILRGDIGITSTDPKIGAYKYCDENLANCFTAASVATNTFLSLTDTPASYAGAASQYVRVNAGTNALEFTNEIVRTVTGEPAPTFMSLDDLTDVDLTVAPTNGQVLSYNGTTWIAAAGGGGGGTPAGADRQIQFNSGGAFWADAGLVYTSAGWLGIGTASPAASLDVLSAGAKTADFPAAQILNTATSATNSINKTGLNISSTGSWTGTSAINYGLRVDTSGGTRNYDVWTGPTSYTDLGGKTTGTWAAKNIFVTEPPNGTAGKNALLGWTRVGTPTINLVQGAMGYVTIENTSGNQIQSMGASGEVYIDAAGDQSSVIGLSGKISKAGAGTVASAYSVIASSTARSGGTIDNAYGFYASDQPNATNNYAVYINQTTAGANNYSLYSAGAGKTYFAGDIGIGTTTPLAQLDIGGTGAVLVPRGDTGQRPGSPVNGMLRYNSANGKFEGYQAGAWQDLLTGAATSTFLSLTDTPASYAGAANQYVRVNAGTNALEFTDQIVGTVSGQPAPDFVDLDDLSDVDLTVAPTNGQVLSYNGTSWIAAAGGGGGTPAGADRQIQFNSGGAFGADASFVYSSAGNFGLGDITPDFKFEASAAGGADSSFGLSDADVIHGLTALDDTDVWLGVRPISSTAGGARLRAYSDANAPALEIYGFIGATNPTDTTPAVKIIGAKKNTTNVQDLGAAETVFQVANNDDAEAFTIRGDGKVGIGTTTPAYMLEVGGLAANARINNVVIGGPAGSSTVHGATGGGGLLNLQNLPGDAFGFYSYANTTAANVFEFEANPNGATENLMQIEKGATPVYTMNNSGYVGLGNFSADVVDSILHLQSGDIRLDGGAGNQAGCIRYDDTTDKLRFSHDCSTFTDMGGGGGTTLDALADVKTDYATDHNIFAGTHATTPGANWPVGAQYNTFFGEQAGLGSGSTTANADFNTGFGYGALRSNTTGVGNTASGYQALYSNTSGYQNMASGVNALYSNTSGINNTATGMDALYANTSGGGNTASGTTALTNNTTGGNNTAVGYQALLSNVAKGKNTAVGVSALYYAHNTATIGDANNTAVGFEALRGSTSAAANTGTLNTAIGAQTLYLNTTGTLNTAAGLQALYSNTTGTQNSASGSQALFNNQAGNYNTASGSSSLYGNQAGTNNTALGFQALFFSNAKSKNTAVGASAMMNAHDTTTPSDSFNTALGFEALMGSGTPANNTGTLNTALGAQALFSNTTGSYNTANGYQALYLNTTGFENTAVGYQALDSNTIGYSNTALGNSTLAANTDGDDNTALGVAALASNTTGSWNTASGRSALASNSTGSSNTAFGYRSLVLATGSSNIALGYQAGEVLSSGSSNIVIGYDIDLPTATASNQLNIGNTIYGDIYAAGGREIGIGDFSADTIDSTLHLQAGDLRLDGGAANQAGCLRYDDTTDKLRYSHDCTTFADLGSAAAAGSNRQVQFNNSGPLGADAGFTFTAGKRLTLGAANSNTFVEGGVETTQGQWNTAIGGAALDALPASCTGTQCSRNTAIGYSTLSANTTGESNTGIGTDTLSSNTTGGGNTAVGMWAMMFNTTGGANTASGAYALHSNTTGIENAADGSSALRLNTTGNYNTASGAGALYNNKAKSQNTAIGYSALGYADDTTTGSAANNTAVGYLALQGSAIPANNTGTSNTAIGAQSLGSNTSGSDNFAGGRFSLFANTTGGYNTASGSFSMRYNTTGGYNTASGYNALISNTTGNDNAAFGVNALGSTQTGNNNVAMGTRAGLGVASNSTSNNVFLGYEAASAVTTGGNNVMIGYQAGNSVTSGASNIVIGYDADLPTATTSNHLNIGNTIYGDLASDYVGIGTNAPASKLHIHSATAAGNTVVDGLRLTHIDSNGAGTGGIGNSIVFEAEDTTFGGFVYETARIESALTSKGGDLAFVINRSLSGDWKALEIDGDGNVWIGEKSLGIGDLTVEGTFSNPSDRRLKEDLLPLSGEDILNKFGQLGTYSYHKIALKDDRREMGVIAQEVEEIFPELVKTNNDEMGMKSVNYIGFIAPLIEASKTLKAENDNLKTQLGALESKMAAVEADMKGMKAHTGYGIGKAGFGLGMAAGMILIGGFGGAVVLTRRRRRAS